MCFTTLSEAVSIHRVGGKAKNLSRVRALGVLVPDTIVLECGTLRSTLETHGLNERVCEYLHWSEIAESTQVAERHRELADALLAAGLPEVLRRRLAEVVGPVLERAPYGLAVRSSAVYEDSEAASFAGVFESWIGVTDLAQCEQRLLECWSSSWAPGALRYLRRMNIEPLVDGMAVMFQPVVNAISSGVIYTADSDTGNPWQFVVRATPGLSVDLLSGSGLGDSFRVEWDTGSITEREVTSKLSSMAATPTGIQSHGLSRSDADRPALTDVEVAAVSEVARTLDEALALRLDIEFVFSRDGLWIVQARPLTALPPFFPHELPDADRNKTWLWAQFIVPIRADLPSGMLTPLYADLSDAERWNRYQPDDIVLTVLCMETRDFNGYRYLPAEKTPMFTDYFEDPSGYETWLDKNEPGYRIRWDRHPGDLAEIARTARTAIDDTTSAAELIPAMFRVRDQLWDLNSFGWSGPQSLGWMCQMLLSDFVKKFDTEFETESLVSGGMDSYTFEVTRGLQELGRSIHEAPIRTAFEQLRLDQVLPHVCETHPGCEFVAEFEAFCWRYGKTPPSWRGRPPFWDIGSDDAALMHTVRCALQGVSRNVEQVQNESRTQRDECERRFRARLAVSSPDLVVRFAKILEWVRYWSQALNDRH